MPGPQHPAEPNSFTNDVNLRKRKRLDLPHERDYSTPIDSHKAKQHIPNQAFSKSYNTPSPPSRLNTTDAVAYHSQRDDYPLSAPAAKSQRILISPRRRMPAQPHSNATTPTKPAPKQGYYPAEVFKPCHVCHRGPKLKTDLDSYAACARCSLRTCYICIRQCAARPRSSSGGQREGSEASGQPDSDTAAIGQDPRDGCGERKICSACCIERGVEGEVWCLDCLENGAEAEADGEDHVMSD